MQFFSTISQIFTILHFVLILSPNHDTTNLLELSIFFRYQEKTQEILEIRAFDAPPPIPGSYPTRLDSPECTGVLCTDTTPPGIFRHTDILHTIFIFIHYQGLDPGAKRITACRT